MLTDNAAYKYEMPYNGPFLITQCWTNGMVTLQCGLIQIRDNILQNNTYTYDTSVEVITT